MDVSIFEPNLDRSFVHVDFRCPLFPYLGYVFEESPHHEKRTGTHFEGRLTTWAMSFHSTSTGAKSLSSLARTPITPGAHDGRPITWLSGYCKTSVSITPLWAKRAMNNYVVNSSSSAWKACQDDAMRCADVFRGCRCCGSEFAVDECDRFKKYCTEMLQAR